MAILWLTPFIAATAQTETITVTGTMKDENGEPIPGVSISIKGTNKGTISDINGNYELKAPLGTTLVFSFVGMKTREAQVTRTGLLPKNSRHIIPYTQKPQMQPDRTKELELLRQQKAYTQRMERYQQYVTKPLDTTLTASMVGDADRHTIKKAARPFEYDQSGNYQFGLIEVNTSWAIRTVGRLPELQRSFAQGRQQNGQYAYQGPETGELFSWGPRLGNLEYGGMPYDFDTHGALVPKGTGNGLAANAYDAANFLKNGFTNRNDITLHQRLGKLKSDLNYGNLFTKDILPGTSARNHSVSLKLADERRFHAWVRYQQQNDELQNKLLQSKIAYSGFVTPPSFDNTNGLSAKQANRNQSSIYTPWGQLRSFAPNHIDNPFFLTQNLQNPSRQTLLAYQASYNFDFAKAFSMALNAGSETTTDKQTIGMQPSSTVLPMNYRYLRNDERHNTHLSANLMFTPARYSWQWNWLSMSMPVRYEHKKRHVYASERVGADHEWKKIADERHTVTFAPMAKADIQNILILSATANFYSSNTLGKTDVAPSLGVALKPLEMLDQWFYTDIRGGWNIRLSGNYAKMPVEYNLAPVHGMANSPVTPSTHFLLLTETIETLPSSDIKPEMVTQKGMNVHVDLRGRFAVEFDLYEHIHRDAIFAIATNQGSTLQNVADYRNLGWESTFSYRPFIRSNFSWNGQLTASQTRSKVIATNSNAPIAIAGFNDVNTALVKGEPVGVIIGSAYQTDADGRTVIGTDGYPMASPNPMVIGNPAPKLKLGFENRFTLYGFELSFLIDARIGGQMWNGTRATLDYYGASAQTGRERHTLDYIFDGVTPIGTPNQTKVDFLPRDGNVYQNRWTRYGTTGVAQAYLEDASQVVLREVGLGYTLPTKTINKLGLNHLKISVFAANIAAVAGYKGVVPDQTLWGHPSGQGLDYFNMPLSQSIGFKLETKF